MILPGPFMTEAALRQTIASLEARAEAAERNGLPRTARSWRDAIENLQKSYKSTIRPSLSKTPGGSRFMALAP